MRTYTALVRPGRPAVLVPEGFSWWALIFGPLWLLRHGALLAALAVAALWVLCLASPAPLRLPLLAGLVLATAAFGQDLRRAGLRLRRFRTASVVAARSRDEALLRLLTHRPDWAGQG